MGQPVNNLKTDNFWGCTIRCLQMLLANALHASKELEIPSKLTCYNSVSIESAAQRREVDILNLFNNDKRASMAPYSIQNTAEIGLKEFGVYPG
mmetsp:Transcript_370/g.546  ORF Transcript_370/g.546 Transcript_370/m.546 type:complete len:94 (-) Transcript_370:957-1238(-)